MLLGHDLPYIHITRPLTTIIITISPGKKCHPDTQIKHVICMEHNEHPLVSGLPSAVWCGILAAICSYRTAMSRCSCLASVRVLMVHKHSCSRFVFWVWQRGDLKHNPTYSPNYEESEHHPLELPLLGRSYFIPQYTNTIDHRLALFRNPCSICAKYCKDLASKEA